MYKIKTGAIEYLEDNGFKRVGKNVYILHFPVYFYKKSPVIFCDAFIDLDSSKEIRLDVRKNGIPYKLWYENNTRFAPKLLKDINTVIDNKMHKIGARHYGDK